MFLKNNKILKTLFNIIFSLASICVIIFFIIEVSNYVCPVKYKDIIDEYSKKYNLEKELVYSVINAESRYNPNALSNKGAIGLMQIMPSTGEWLIEIINSSNSDDFKITSDENLIELLEKKLYTPEVNIQLGCFYLKYLIDKFQNEENALCAYNAGSTNVNEWLQNPEYSENGVLTEIPFGETKRYIEKIKYFKIGYTIKLGVLDIIKNII